MHLSQLERFNEENLPDNEDDQYLLLHANAIERIICFVLGPDGTNMVQACKQWISKTGIEYKAEIVLCETPEESIERAREICEDGHIAIFWTCAVYNRLFNVFFENPDTLTFFIQIAMNLDEMQLAIKEEKSEEIKNGEIPMDWKVASHPSPAPLLNSCGCEVVLTTSNAKAAELCANSKVDICITTESARKIYGLQLVYRFGSPKMVFFGGITAYSVEFLSQIWREIK